MSQARGAFFDIFAEISAGAPARANPQHSSGRKNGAIISADFNSKGR